jgi:hypothetical protein
MKQSKLDLARERPEFFTAKAAPEVVRLPAAKYLAIDGGGSPESPEFQRGIQAMYGVAYTLRALSKHSGRDYKVSTLEGQWWSDVTGPTDPDALWSAPRESWRWRLLIMVPDFTSKKDLAAAKEAVGEKHGGEGVEHVFLETVKEGLCLQALHVGPYSTEPASIGRMRALMDAKGLKPAGLHHEVYLGDPRRTKPEKLKTLLRQPVAKA